MLARLRLIEVLLPRLGVAAASGGPDGGGGGFAPEPLMGFLSAALGNANAEVGPQSNTSTLKRSASTHRHMELRSLDARPAVHADVLCCCHTLHVTYTMRYTHRMAAAG